MLVLSRKIGEIITIGSSIRITILSFDRGIVRLGIDAPKSIPVHRKEVYDKIIDMNRQAARTELTALKKAITRSMVNFKEKTPSALQPSTLYFTSNADNKNTNVNE